MKTALPPPVLQTRSWVTLYALLDRGVGFNGRGSIFIGGTLLGRVPRLAISNGDDGEWWLMHCGRTWNVRTAFPYGSLDEAQAAAERRYPGSASRWKRTGYNKAKAEAYLDRVWKGETCTFCGRRPDQIDQMFMSRKRPVARICDVCIGKLAPAVEADRAKRAEAERQLVPVSAGEPLSVFLQSRFLVLIDPLALDLLRDPLQALPSLCEAHQIERLGQLTTTLRIGVREIDGFTPGSYRLGPGDIVPARGKGRDVVDVDSGAIVVTGLDSLPAVAKALTRERYDALLGLEAVTAARWLAKVVGPRFAVLRADADRPFSGDGSYRLARQAPTRVDPPVFSQEAPDAFSRSQELR
jgi:hypothetical protein